MALTLSRANRILEKAFSPYPPKIRAANHFEASVNAYGEKLRWVIDAGERQALRAYPTLNAAIAAAAEQGWEKFDAAQLTPSELAELRQIPMQVTIS